MTEQDRFEAFESEVMALPVFDTHAHLQAKGAPPTAQSFSDIGHYFWLVQELGMAGYPREYWNADPASFFPAFAKAFPKIRTTMMGRLCRDVCAKWFDQPTERPLDARLLDAAIRQRASDPGRAETILADLNIRYVTMNQAESVPIRGAEARSCYVPWEPGRMIDAALEKASGAPDQREVVRVEGEAIAQCMMDLRASGVRGIRVDHFLEAEELLHLPELKAMGNPEILLRGHLLRALLDAAAAQRFFIQLFLGMRRGCGPSVPAHDPLRIQRLHPVFAAWPECDFELLEASLLNQAAVAQAARSFPNVYAGGLWWFNFRPFAYREAFALRLDELPPQRSCIVASDATTAEWCWAKIRMVKRELARFLWARICAGDLNRADALWLAQEWLHDAAARRYAQGSEASTRP